MRRDDEENLEDANQRNGDASKPLPRPDAKVLANAYARIIAEADLRDRLERDPIETMTKELGLEILPEHTSLLAGKRLSEVFPELVPEVGMQPLAIPIAIVAVTAITGAPAVYAGVKVITYAPLPK